MSSRWAVALCVLLLTPQAVCAAWEVVRETDLAGGPARPIALTTNRDGYRLSVQPLPGGLGARCVLDLPDGTDGSIDPDGLPALEVDARPAQEVAQWEPSEEWDDGGDFVEALRRELRIVPLVDLALGRVVFDCWLPLPRQVSPTRGVVRQLLDGREMIVRFGLTGGEYDETTFSLVGAREAVGQALDIPVEPSRGDLLQDELLTFRIDYRKTTCYMLNGRKRQKRCLRAVEECRLRDHQSVVSMLGCIEGE